MIFETAMGDAYGVAWEFVPKELVPVHDWSGYKARPQTGDRAPEPAGRFTDDTLRTIANARVVLAGASGEPLAYVAAIKAVFRADRRPGWSRNFHAFLESQIHEPDSRWGEVVVRRNTNGALMGAAVMGVLESPEEVAGAARVQALVTHDAEAADYAASVALASFALRTGACAPQDLVEWVHDVDPATPSGLRAACARSDRIDMSAARTAGAVLRVLGEARSLRAVIDATIAMGGDTDSVAAAGLGIAAQAPGWFAPDLPAWMARDLEGPQGGGTRALLRSLDHDLAVWMQR